MPDFYLIRKAVAPELNDKDLEGPLYKPELQKGEIEKWLDKATTEPHTDLSFGDEHNKWLVEFVAEAKKNGLSLDSPEFAAALKEQFLGRFKNEEEPDSVDRLPYDPQEFYKQARDEIMYSLASDASPAEIIAVICKAELMAQDPERINKAQPVEVEVIPEADARLFEAIRGRIAVQRQSLDYSENDHIFPPAEPLIKDSKPTIKELLNWADECGLLTQDLKSTYKDALKNGQELKPEYILKQLTAAFNSSMSPKIKRKDSRDDIVGALTPIIDATLAAVDKKVTISSTESKIALLCGNYLDVLEKYYGIITPSNKLSDADAKLVAACRGAVAEFTGDSKENKPQDMEINVDPLVKPSTQELLGWIRESGLFAGKLINANTDIDEIFKQLLKAYAAKVGPLLEGMKGLETNSQIVDPAALQKDQNMSVEAKIAIICAHQIKIRQKVKNNLNKKIVGGLAKTGSNLTRSERALREKALNKRPLSERSLSERSLSERSLSNSSEENIPTSPNKTKTLKG